MLDGRFHHMTRDQVITALIDGYHETGPAGAAADPSGGGLVPAPGGGHRAAAEDGTVDPSLGPNPSNTATHHPGDGGPSNENPSNEGSPTAEERKVPDADLAPDAEPGSTQPSDDDSIDPSAPLRAERSRRPTHGDHGEMVVCRSPGATICP